MPLPNFEFETIIYKSCKDCAEQRYIPIAVLIASRHIIPKPPGQKANGSIAWHEFQPWIIEHYSELVDNHDTQLEKLELRKLKGEVVKLENYNRTRSKDFISRKLVLKTVGNIYANVFAQLSRYLLEESPSKNEGMSANQLKAANKEFLVSLFSSLKLQENIWQDAKDLGEEVTEEKPDSLLINNENENDTTRDI